MELKVHRATWSGEHPQNSLAGLRECYRERVARVEVVAETSGAEVFIDGRSRGVTPLARPVLVEAGPHQVVVQPASGAPPFDSRSAQGANWSYARELRIDEAALRSVARVPATLAPSSRP